jgi:hypothetical protein
MILRTLILCAALAAPALASGVTDELIYRVSSGRAEDVRLLAKRAGNVNITDNAGWPLLSIASARADGKALEMVRILHEEGADLNYGGSGLNYPLFIAVQSGNADVVQYLLENGADYRVRDIYGMTLTDFAAQSGNTDVADLVEQAVLRDKQAYADARSPEAFAHHYHGLARNACAHQYYAFYYKSGQDPVDPKQQEMTLTGYQTEMSRHLGQLQHYFHVSNEAATALIEKVRADMRDELEKLVSNRWRRQHGVGQAGDEKERCERLTEPYQNRTPQTMYTVRSK